MICLLVQNEFVEMKIINKQIKNVFFLKYSAVLIHIRYSVQGILLHKNISSLLHTLMMQLVHDIF